MVQSCAHDDGDDDVTCVHVCARSHTCGVACSGLFYTMTGDFKKTTDADADADADADFKPSDRQIYCYNLTTGGFVFENNGDKTRGGAGSVGLCACVYAS